MTPLEMTSPATVFAPIKTATPEEASFYSLSYVSTLQQCTASAYGSTLKSVVSSTAATSLYGDGLAACVVRCRLETERQATERLTSVLLQELPQLPTCGLQSEGRLLTLAATTDQEGDCAPKHSGVFFGPRVSSAASHASSKVSSSKSIHSPEGGPPGGSLVNASSDEPFTKDGPVAKSSFLVTSPSFRASSSAQISQCDMAVLHLRVGLCRALGWPVSPELQVKGNIGFAASGGKDLLGPDGGEVKGLLTQLVDSLLSRYSYANVLGGQRVTYPCAASTTRSSTAGDGAHMFMHLEDTEFRQSIILDWVEDVFVFAHYQGFTAHQTQCVVLDSLLILDMIDRQVLDASDTAGHVAWEEQLMSVLQEVVSAQTCVTTVRAIETVLRREPVVIQVPDPQQLSELLEKQQKALSPKVLASLEVAKQNLPLVSQTVMQDVEVELGKDVTLRPVFSMSEAGAVVEYITRSVVMHRRLWSVLLAPGTKDYLTSMSTTATAASATHAVGRPFAHQPICVAVESVAPIFMPSLSSFRTDALQTVIDAQRRVFEDFLSEREQLVSKDWQEPLLAITADELSERSVLEDAAAQADAVDRAAALTLQQCARVQRAYELRLEDILKCNTHVVRGEPCAESEPPAAPPASEVVPALPPARSNAGKTKKKSAPGASTVPVAAAPVLSSERAASVVLPSNVAFALAEVEARIDRIAAAIEEMSGGGASQRTVTRKS